eukprot:8881717-Pyramimonas_sp.AAC.1
MLSMPPNSFRKVDVVAMAVWAPAPVPASMQVVIVAAGMCSAPPLPHYAATWRISLPAYVTLLTMTPLPTTSIAGTMDAGRRGFGLNPAVDLASVAASFRPM